MTDAEYVLRFLTLAEAWKDFSGDLSQSMNTFMERYRFADRRRLRAFGSSFTRSLRACEEIFGWAAFKRPEGSVWRDQALAGAYDAEMVAIAELTDDELAQVMNDTDRAVEATLDLFFDDDFEQSVRQATNTPSRVYYRVSKLVEAFRAL